MRLDFIPKQDSFTHGIIYLNTQIFILFTLIFLYPPSPPQGISLTKVKSIVQFFSFFSFRYNLCRKTYANDETLFPHLTAKSSACVVQCVEYFFRLLSHSLSLLDRIIISMHEWRRKTSLAKKILFTPCYHHSINNKQKILFIYLCNFSHSSCFCHTEICVVVVLLVCLCRTFWLLMMKCCTKYFLLLMAQ